MGELVTEANTKDILVPPEFKSYEHEVMNYEQCMQYRSDVIDARFGYLQQGLGCTEVNQCLRECGAGYSWWVIVGTTLGIITVIVLVLSAILNKKAQSEKLIEESD